ncbi:MAG: Ti-type conjugative transfer relaxase TraA [Burkholderiales bacterium]|nr:Ti-type conjugative transfer relaxase TraA [Burkholderiales bacterium]
MAIYHCTTTPVSRSSGRSSVAAAAYRSGSRLENLREGQVYDYTPRKGIEHAAIVLPAGSKAEWARDRSRLWNAAEAAEKRKDARVAREVEVSLPHELDAAQRQALAEAFAAQLADRYRVAVDLAIHSPHGKTDARNHHAHLLMTTRTLTADGLGEKSMFERENRTLAAEGLPTSHDQIRRLREDWGALTNQHLARAALDLRVDHRSNLDRGLELAPTEHMGVHATQMLRKGMEVSRTRLSEPVARQNAAVIREHPDQVLTIITGEKSVFDQYDVARTVHRYTEGIQDFQSVYAKAMASPALVQLTAERRDAAGRIVAPAQYSTRAMVEIEQKMAERADRLSAGGGYRVDPVMRAAALAGEPRLDAEQRRAVEHVTGPERLSVVVGYAGSGKSSMLAVAREAWEAQGYRVQGAALAGKAAEGLRESSGIESRTVASLERSWDRGHDLPQRGDVIVVDEAGMLSSQQLGQVLARADAGGAKVVLVGDPGQLQPIQAGAGFRAVAERVGSVQMESVRRQSEDWQRAASVDFGRHQTALALGAYAERGRVQMEPTREAAKAAIVREVIADQRERPEGSRLVLAHRRDDVRELNQTIRSERQAQGELRGERSYQTTEGQRAFAPGDRVLFRENDHALGVKNGMLGTVQRAEAGQLTARLDSPAGPGQGREVSVSTAQYGAVDHGYATTIHKSQGTTVDRTYVLASGSMDRHLSYVAMTRHREDAKLYAGRDEFHNRADLVGRLSRENAKTTTLDYRQAVEPFAERRGRELRSDIVLREPAREPARDPVRESAGGQVRVPTREPASDPVRDPARDTARSTATDPKREVADLAVAWKQMEQKLDQLSGRQNRAERNEVVGQMREVAARIRDNPQLRETFTGQQRELGVRRDSGLDRAVRERNLDRAMREVSDRDRDRGR